MLRKKEPGLLDRVMRYRMNIFLKESRDTGYSTPNAVVVAAATLGEIYGRCAMTPKNFEMGGGGCSCQDGEISKAPADKYRTLYFGTVHFFHCINRYPTSIALNNLNGGCYSSLLHQLLRALAEACTARTVRQTLSLPATD